LKKGDKKMIEEIVEEKIEDEKIEVIKKKRVEFQLDEDLLKLLDIRAEIKEISRSEYIRNLILKDVGNINNSIDIDTLKKIKRLMVEFRKMRIAFTKLGVVFNQGIKLFIKGKKRELETLEDELINLLKTEKEKLEDYKKYLL
jgi:ribbon-helix-helix protein, copG family